MAVFQVGLVAVQNEHHVPDVPSNHLCRINVAVNKCDDCLASEELISAYYTEYWSKFIYMDDIHDQP